MCATRNCDKGRWKGGFVKGARIRGVEAVETLFQNGWAEAGRSSGQRHGGKGERGKVKKKGKGERGTRAAVEHNDTAMAGQIQSCFAWATP